MAELRTPPDVRFTAAEAATLLGLSSQQIVQTWVRRGKLRPVGYRPGGAQLFAWADLVAARMTRRPHTSVHA
jgi:hypothetical protein